MLTLKQLSGRLPSWAGEQAFLVRSCVAGRSVRACRTAALARRSAEHGTALFQASSSGIRIDRVDLHASGGGSLWWGSECVAVTNVGTLAVSQVTLDFAWTQPNGANESDEIEVLNGPLASGATMGSLTGTVQSAIVSADQSRYGGRFAQRASARIRYQCRLRERDDMESGSSGRRAHGQPEGSPATLSAVNTYDYAAPRVLTAWHVPADLLPLACSTITSQSEKTITDVRIVYHHLALAGADLGDDVLNVHSTTLSHGQGANCRAFVATVQPGLLTYAQNAANGLALQPPVSLYKGSPSVVSVEVTGVAYADGTSWQMPSDHAAPVNSPAPTPSDGPIFLPLPSSGIRINRVYFLCRQRGQWHLGRRVRRHY